MSNIIPMRQMRKATVPVHRVTLDLVPHAIVAELFYAAIAVGWAADEGEFSATTSDAQARLAALQRAVCNASQFTTIVNKEIEEPVR